MLKFNLPTNRNTTSLSLTFQKPISHPPFPPAMSSGIQAYFQLVVKKVIPCSLAHKPATSTRYILDLDFIKIRLFDKVVPKTCHNFKELCTHNQGFGYAGSSIDHVVRGFGLYGG